MVRRIGMLPTVGFEDCGGVRDIHIQVILYSGNVCSDHTLTVTGNSCSGANTCSTL